MKSGKAIIAGSNCVENLIAIATWKSQRRAALIRHNEQSAIADALDVAREDSPAIRTKLEKLVSLSGVGVPMASAILTAMYPETVTVIDRRALDSLGVTHPNNLIAIYEDYLGFCISKAAEFKMTLREFDRALWKSGVM